MQLVSVEEAVVCIGAVRSVVDGGPCGQYHLALAEVVVIEREGDVFLELKTDAHAKHEGVGRFVIEDKLYVIALTFVFGDVAEIQAGLTLEEKRLLLAQGYLVSHARHDGDVEIFGYAFRHETAAVCLIQIVANVVQIM